MPARPIWRHDPEARLAAFAVTAVDGVTLYLFNGPSTAQVAALDREGRIAWKSDPRTWMSVLRVYQDRVYCGGAVARCFDPATGTVLAEADFGDYVVNRHPIVTGPVYWFPDGKRLLGLSPGNLSVAWQWSDPDEEFIAHDGLLVRYRREGELTLVDLSNQMSERTLAAPPLTDYA